LLLDDGEERREGKSQTHRLLELGQIRRGKRVSLRDNGDKVNASPETLHDLDVKGLEAVTGRADEVKAGVNTEVELRDALGLLLLTHEGLVLVVLCGETG
jgi:hypothetical protein